VKLTVLHLHCLPRGHEDQKPNQNRQSYYARQHRKLAPCMNADVGILGTRVFVIFGLANSTTSRGSLRQLYRIRESNQFSAALTVHQTASLCEEMRKSLRTYAGYSLKQVPDCHRAGRDDACRDRRIGPTASHMLALGILGGQLLPAVGAG
jgi:hypothetical protein